MRNNFWIVSAIIIVFTLTGCGKGENAGKNGGAFLETVESSGNSPLMYIDVAGAEASSFDQTPDWAPEPNPMAPVDGDMLTRWSSDYSEDEQWISFDLGEKRVISDIIIRWERAHATEYKILGSVDGEHWQELFHETAGRGGAMEAKFPPVVCRYVKILGIKRVNDDWGISIWEVEIYGTKEHNPMSKITKKEYLSRAEDEAKKEEAKKLLQKLAAPVVPIAEKPFQKGVVYTSWMADELEMAASDFTLAALKEMGIDTVAIMVPAYQEKIDSKKIFVNDGPDGDTPSIDALKHAVQSCHKLGLRVMIKPHVDPRTDEARINIMPSEEWFDSFEKFTLKYAKFSQKYNVEMFSVGTELEATTFEAWAPRWEQVIAKVKEVYKGVLTYSANWTEFEEVPFWGEMDFVGIDAYFPLTEKNDPSYEELVGAWEQRADKIEKWLKEKGLTEKGVLFTEIGYPSADGANRQPWVAISKVEDQKEQADCLNAMFEVLSKRNWFKGFYLWQYFPQERWSPLGFTINGKESESVVKDWLKKLD